MRQFEQGHRVYRNARRLN